MHIGAAKQHGYTLLLYKTRHQHLSCGCCLPRCCWRGGCRCGGARLLWSLLLRRHAGCLFTAARAACLARRAHVPKHPFSCFTCSAHMARWRAFTLCFKLHTAYAHTTFCDFCGAARAHAAPPALYATTTPARQPYSIRFLISTCSSTTATGLFPYHILWIDGFWTCQTTTYHYHWRAFFWLPAT